MAPQIWIFEHKSPTSQLFNIRDRYCAAFFTVAIIFDLYSSQQWRMLYINVIVIVASVNYGKEKKTTMTWKDIKLEMRRCFISHTPMFDRL